jgi:hypothetical protein
LTPEEILERDRIAKDILEKIKQRRGAK